MVALLWSSGNPLVDNTPLMKPWYASMAFFMVAIILVRRSLFSRRDIWLIGGFSTIVAAQVISTEYIGLLSVIGFFSKLVMALAVVRLIRNFPKVYVNAMFWTAIISFPFFALMIATKGRMGQIIEPLALNVPDPYFLVHYFPSNHLLQNNSYFWEPGVFAGHLVLAIICLGAIQEEYSFKRYRLIVFVLLAAVASTKSTGGFLITPLAMTLHGKAFGKNMVIRAAITLAAIAGFVFLFSNADFLGSKINSQVGQLQGGGRGWQLTRLGSMIYDFRLIKIHPIVGWGPNPDVGNGVVDLTVEKGEGNGITNFMSHFGICGMVFFIVSAWLGFRDIFHGKWMLATLSLITVMGMLNDEPFLSFPLFMTLMFLRRPVLQFTENVGISREVSGNHIPLRAVNDTLHRPA
jgi:hypothetical protein